MPVAEIEKEKNNTEKAGVYMVLILSLNQTQFNYPTTLTRKTIKKYCPAVFQFLHNKKTGNN